MVDSNRSRGRVAVFACGGTGANVAKTLETWRGKTVDGFAVIDTVYVDTSRSNLSEDIPEEAIYLIKDKDGSGGLRSENATPISKSASDVLQRHPPQALNIVISSAAGGTGSVAGPALVNELIKGKHNTVVILIGGVDTKQWINNTLNTLKSYEKISLNNESSIVMQYLQNESNSKREPANEQARYLITTLSALFSNQNQGLDSKDLEHWLQFDRVSSFEPQLVSLEAVADLDKLQSKGNLISVATLVDEGGVSDLPATVDYQCIGYIPTNTAENLKNGIPIHFVTTDGLFEEVGASLNKSLSELNARAKARTKRASLVSDDDEALDNGLVL